LQKHHEEHSVPDEALAQIAADLRYVCCFVHQKCTASFSGSIDVCGARSERQILKAGA